MQEKSSIFYVKNNHIIIIYSFGSDGKTKIRPNIHLIESGTESFIL